VNGMAAALFVGLPNIMPSGCRWRAGQGADAEVDMAQRHTVYLKQSAAKVSPEELLAGIQEVELGFIAEVCKVPFDRIDDALRNLRMENVKPPGFLFYRLCYRTEGRQIDVERWRTPEEAKSVIGETIDNLDPDATSFRAVRDFLNGCVDTVSASYGSSMPNEAMAPILGSEVCRWLAEKFGGILRDPCGDWYELAESPDLKLIAMEKRP
jgi:hypothetical protein